MNQIMQPYSGNEKVFLQMHFNFQILFYIGNYLLPGVEVRWDLSLPPHTYHKKIYLSRRQGGR